MSAANTYVWQASEPEMILPRWDASGEGKKTEKFRENRACARGFDFDADDWYFDEYAPKSEQHVRQIHLHFTNPSGDQVKHLLKQYAAWRLGRVRPVTVRLELYTRLNHWQRFLHVRRIEDPRRFGNDELEQFAQWLRMQDISENVCERIIHTVIHLIVTGQQLGWKVTGDKMPRGCKGMEPLRNNKPWQQPGLIIEQQCDRIHRLEDKDTPTGTGETLPIPEKIYEQILCHAVYDETDEITRSGIIIQSQTGLRISEVLSLEEHCLRRDGTGNWRLMYRLKKTVRSEPQQRLIPANRLVCETVERLAKSTEALRRESGRKELFLVRNHGIRPVSQTNWNRGRLKNFLHRWEITDENGSEYELHSHQFRATYVRNHLLSGGQTDQIQARFGHVSPEMTARYVHLSEKELEHFLAPCMYTIGR